jgi:hypothetical protein
MEESHTADLRQSPVLRRLEQFVTDVRSRPVGELGSFADFELSVRAQLMELGREIVTAELARYDLTVPEIVVQGVEYRRALRSRQTYMSAVGPVSLERQLYCPRGGNGRAICPLEERVGMVGGFWTPRAGYEAARLVAEVTPGEAEGLLREISGMNPSKTSLDRLPKTLSAVWEGHREKFEAALRESEAVPKDAVSLTVSLDGVLTPMRDGERVAKRSQADRRPKGPAGYREVGCAAISFYDAAGERLSTLRWARMPEEHKATLCNQIEAELTSILRSRPDLQVVKLADGAISNWEFLDGLSLPGTRDRSLVDFFHACEHLKRALDAAYGENSVESGAAFETYRWILKESDEGAERVIRKLVYLRRKHRNRGTIGRELMYFRNQRHRMAYAQALRKHLPIGSGIVEAACKTLVAQRMKRSGMRWLQSGGQAILTLRSLIQSDRWERGWMMLAGSFRETIYITEKRGHLNVLKAA